MSSELSLLKHSSRCSQWRLTSDQLVTRRLYATKTTDAKSNKPPKIPLFIRLKNAGTFVLASAVVIGAVGIAGIVIYLIVGELFFPSGDTQTFNRAVKLVENDPASQQLLEVDPESGKTLKAYGETPNDKWTRNRPLSSVRRIGKDGKEHLYMRFHVESYKTSGTVQLEAIDETFYKQKMIYLALDVPGQKRHYIIAPQVTEIVPPKTGFLGLRWGPKKD